MSRKLTAVLAVIAVCTGAFLFFSERMSLKENGSVIQDRLVPWRKDMITVLRIEKDYWTSVELRRISGNGGWNVYSPFEARANETRISELLLELETTRFLNTIDGAADDPFRLREYGIDRPGIILTVETASRSRTMVFGNSTPDNDGYYMLCRDRGTVFVAPLRIVDLLRKDPEFWINVET